MRNDTPLDLASLDTAARAEEGAVLQLRHPATEEPLGVYVTLAGADSGICRKAQMAIGRKRIRRMKTGAVSPEEAEEEALELLSRCTLGWEGVTVDAQVLDFSRENAVALYRRFPWIREQVDRFIGDRANYIKN
ncbi:hypothetical protein GGQ74_001136 [Desulfobaculum xiamenense]|uniref:Uncharacterized protein n=1 Tax=Desulfobaculum xiamenense TaxID=995050 RepID=A0A846QFD2_9BACT|nr:hypothetical protein [Desulfobaculum xiamenense]NJB67496.1 hypothetical protein [Desulfobaculum xiamenense]